MRVILTAVLLLAAATLSGCSSPSVPSWAVEAAKSDLREKHVSSPRPKKTLVAKRSVGDVEADAHKINDSKIDKVIVDHPASTGRASSTDDRVTFFRELDRRQEEERRKIDEVLTICRGC